MKNIVIVPALFVVLFVLSTAPPARACEISLFSDPGAVPEQSDGISARVLRQRTAQLNIFVADLPEMDHLCLNLFHDIRLTVQLAPPSESATGTLLIEGHIMEAAEGYLILAAAENQISAVIKMPAATFKIRPRSDGYYTIREIAHDDFRYEFPEDQTRSTVRQSTPLTAEREVLDLVNDERAETGLHAIDWNNRLFEAARKHSADMALENYFSHESLDGRKFSDRITAEGYIYNSVAENIAAGYDTPQKAMEAWMASDGHRENILRDSVCELGVGYAYDAGSDYGHYWTQDFGRQQGVTVCPATTDPPDSDPPDPAPSTNENDTGSSGSGGGGCFLDSIP